MLFEFITLNREEIISRCRAKVVARSNPAFSATELDHGVPLFLDQLVEMLQSGRGTVDIDHSAGQHGHDLLLKGFTISQVVHDYGDVCQTITDLALETQAPISTDDFRTLNPCLDEAIASAVTMYERDSLESHGDRVTDRHHERMGFLIHELRNLISTAVVAFEVLKTGNVGVGGSTGAVLSRSLTAVRDLIARSVDQVWLTKATENRTRLLLAEFIADIEAAARLEAETRGVTFVVPPVREELAVEADRLVLAAVMGNLLQNAFKFTRPHTTVTLQVRATTARVLIEVHDECGGIPGASERAELVPSFEQRGTDRSGLGIGLAFSRWGVESNGGRLYARNLPGTGCVFTVDLPQSSVSAVARVR